MKASEIILEEYKDRLAEYLVAKAKYKEFYTEDFENKEDLIFWDGKLRRAEGVFAPLTQAYKDALFMEGEISKKAEIEKYKPENLYRFYDSIKDTCSKCKKGTLEETICMEGVDGWENHIAVACRLCQEEGVVRKNANL